MIGYPIHIATKEYQRRKHHKKRIDKKWRKKYSFEDANIALSVEEEYVDIGPMTPWDNKYIRPIRIPNQIKITISMQKIYSSIIYYSRNFYRW